MPVSIYLKIKLKRNFSAAIKAVATKFGKIRQNDA